MTQHRILLASPMRASHPEACEISYGYARSIIRYARDVSVDFMGPDEMFAPEDLDDLGYGPDLVRLRSRIVRMALESPRNYTAIWWWDTDIVPRDPALPARMLMTGHDLIFAPYPRKRIKWDEVARYAAEEAAAGRPATPEGLEDAGVDYPIRDGQYEVGKDDCADVPEFGLGYAFTSTKALRKMVEAYAPTLSFGDVMNGQRIRTVALFQLLLPRDLGERPDDPLRSEDYSFCARARLVGLQPKLYVGPGTPLSHVGAYVYSGLPSAPKPQPGL